MAHFTFRRTLSLFIVVLLLAASTASAAVPARSIEGWSRTALSWLAEAVGWGPDTTFRRVAAPKHGCDISPDGTPRCTPVVAPKHGCSIDPNGTPRCTG